MKTATKEGKLHLGFNYNSDIETARKIHFIRQIRNSGERYAAILQFY